MTDLRLRLCTIKRIDLTSSQHIRENQIFKNLDTLRRACIVVIIERLEEILAGTIPLVYSMNTLRFIWDNRIEMTYALPSTFSPHIP